MVNQKLVFHVVIYEREFENFVLSRNQIVLEEFIDVWCKQHGLRLVAVSVQPDHLHLIVEQREDLAIQRTISRLRLELRHWPEMEPPTGAEFQFALFTVSFPMLDRLIRFVESQNQHHLNVSFEEELTSLVDKHDVDLCDLPASRKANSPLEKRMFA